MPLVNSISQTAPGITSVAPSGLFTGTLPTGSGQLLTTTGPNAYLWGSSFPQVGQGGVIQYISTLATAYAGQGVALTQTGTSTSLFNVLARVSGATITPMYPTSKMFLFYELTAATNTGSNLVYFNGYNTSSSSSPFISCPVGDNSVTGGVQFQGSAMAQIPNSYPATTVVSICGFRTDGTNTPFGIYGSDTILLIEQSAAPVSPFSTLVTGSGALLCLSFPVPTNSSLMVEGQFAAFSITNNYVGNGGNFSVVAIRQAGSIALADNNYTLNTVLPLGQAPYLYAYANNSTQALEFYAVGNGVDTFMYNITFTSS